MLSGEDMQRPRTAERLPSNNSIELKDVRFAYHDKEVLHGVNLHIAPGGTVKSYAQNSLQAAKRSVVMQWRDR